MRKIESVNALRAEAQRLALEYHLTVKQAMLVLDVFALDDFLTSTKAGRELEAEFSTSGAWDDRPVIEQLTEEYPQFATPDGQARLRELRHAMASVDD